MKRLLQSLFRFDPAHDDQLELRDYLPDGLESIDPEHFTIDDLIQKVAIQRGRPIELVPMPLPANLYGARLSGPSRDYIIYEINTALVHQDHIKAHELGHILADHEIMPITADTSFEDAVAFLLMRANQEDSYEEREAEDVANAIQNEIIRCVGLHALTRQVATTPVWSDLARGFGID